MVPSWSELKQWVYADDIILIKQKMLDSFTGVLHVDHKLQPGFTNNGIRLPHGVGWRLS